MALVRKLERRDLERDTVHGETEGTYSIVSGPHGEKYLQVNTYGSAERKVKGKVSQTIQFSPEAIAQLREILTREF